MTDVHDDIQAAFDDVRGELGVPERRPPASEIIRRARRRRRTQAAVVGTAAVLAFSTTAMVETVHPLHRKAVTPVSPTPSLPEPTRPAKAVRATDLVHARDAREDRRHWSRTTFPSRTGDVQQPMTPQCGPADRLQWPADGPTGNSSGYELVYAPGVDRTNADNLRGEQVMALGSVQAAHRAMVQILQRAQRCGSLVTVDRPAIGDEALSLSHSYVPEGAQAQAVEQAVAVRQGTAVAIYWDVHRGGTSSLTTLTQHESDARTMAGRLCGLGYGC